MSDDRLKDPPVPADLDMRKFESMPLGVVRLRGSKAWLVCKRRPELAFYMVNLWTAAWHEKPAGSLEDDDDVLADKAMCDPKRWASIREDVLRGWTRCTDGRLYHPVVCEVAMDAARKRTEWRDKKRGQRRGQGEDVSEDNKGTTRIVPKDNANSPEGKSHKVREGKVREEDASGGQSQGQTPDTFALTVRLLRMANLPDVRAPNEIGIVRAWLEAGALPDLDIVPTVERVVARGGTAINGLKYFGPMVEEARGRRAASEAELRAPKLSAVEQQRLDDEAIERARAKLNRGRALMEALK